MRLFFQAFRQNREIAGKMTAALVIYLLKHAFSGEKIRSSSAYSLGDCSNGLDKKYEIIL